MTRARAVLGSSGLRMVALTIVAIGLIFIALPTMLVAAGG
jgi:hypothetical protein